MADNSQLKELLNALGLIAEMSLNFYRAAINAGANRNEAAALTQAFIAAQTRGNPDETQEGE